MKILLYEYVSGGGFAGESIPSSILSEGFAMLRGLSDDFKAAGHIVTVMLDSRLIELSNLLDVNNLLQVNSDAKKTLIEAADTVEAAFTIAPEHNRILQSTVEMIENLGIISLNCSADSIGQASDKASLPERLKQLNVLTPQTFLFGTINIKEIIQVIKEKLGFPVIIKPANGAGCCGISIVKNIEQVTLAVNKIKKETFSSQIIVQKYIDGTPVSVSLFSTCAQVIPISLNKQELTIASPDSESRYNGGMVPFDNTCRDLAFSEAIKVVQSFKGLRGYVGVDLVLSANKAYVIEVNPRLTTSYVGLRKVATTNLAQAIIDSAYKKQNPIYTQLKGYSCFSKVQISDCNPIMYEKAKKIPEIVSPPLSLLGGNSNYAFIEAHGQTLGEALSRFGEAKNRLNRICAGR